MPLSSRTLTISLAALALAACVASPVRAQARRVLASDDPEAQLMGYYAAALYFSPAGWALPGTSIGADVGVIPYLSADQRRVAFGGTKYEDANRCPVAPRLRVAHYAGRFLLEGGLIPPLTVCGVTAGLVAAAVSTGVPVSGSTALLVRGSVMAGQLSASITCSASEVANPADQTCFGGTPSDDKVKPFTLGLEGGVAHRAGDRLRLYVLGGVRREQVDFDVNFDNPSLVLTTGTFSDHGRLQTTLTRAHVALGGEASVSQRVGIGAEWFYAPGALATVRLSATWALHPLKLQPAW